MAQPQRPADVHQDELCPPNKHYALMDANKKIDLDNSFSDILCKKLDQRHYMNAFLEISHRDRDKYHNLEDDAVVKNILNSGKHKDSVGIKILNWMITDEMKLTDHYRMLEPRIDKESLKVEIIAEVQPVNINEEVEESAEDDYDLKQREKGKHVVESRITPSPTTIRSPRTHSTLISSDNEKL
ncbi:hypothetical protein Tco_1398769 [Tanacetum coccineum]